MLLERIEIDSCGSLERIQLGPFSHRLNAVYGPRGAGKTATLEFLRSVMLGTDRHWHRGSTGSVVWADGEGLLHCRREGDGTSAGRLSIDYLARNGRMHDHHYGYRDPLNYDHLQRMTELPRQTIDSLVAATRQTPLTAILDACRLAGLETVTADTNDAAIARLRTAISELNRRLDAYHGVAATRADLETTHRRLLGELDAMDREERAPARSDSRREELTARLSEAHEEVARLSHQESELRHLISEIERDLAHSNELPRVENSNWRIAVAHRRELEELDDQLMHWRRTLREVCSIRDSLGELSHDFYLGERDGDGESRHSHRAVPSRLESACRQIDLLAQRYDPSILDRSSAEFPGGETVTESLWAMREELSQIGRRLRDRHPAESHESERAHLRRCEEALVRSIDRLIDARNLLLRRIAAEYDVPLGQLVEAFGDWRQCHDHPHLYQWLLSDKCPPRIDDIAVHASRRSRLEQEQAELLEQLGRTVNRLDDQASEIRVLQLRLRQLPVAPPTVVDPRRREDCRSELLRIEERLRWLDSRVALDEQRQQLQRQLNDLLRDAPRPSLLLTAASRWLCQLAPERPARLWIATDGELRIDGGALAQMGDIERQTIAMAIRMAAADELGRRGHQIPLLIDELPIEAHTADARARLAAALARFTESGRQMIVFTENRPLAEAIRNMGGRLQSLATPQYIQMRYRDDRRPAETPDPLSSVNRDLDTIWRESQGLYDDPYWYQKPQRPRESAPSGGIESRLESRLESDFESDPASSGQASRGPASPFFLTGDSPVDQAPSIDAVAADRLARIGITRVGQLLSADPRHLADRLALADVTPRVVHRWQSEAELVCNVPQLRNFDARVLVGCGLNDAKQLAQMHPGQLLETVETFLATDRGRLILQSGTSYELSRITSWIAAANRSVARGLRHGDRRRRRKHDGQERTSGRHRQDRQQPREIVPAPRRVVSLPMAASASASEADADLTFYLQRRSPVVEAPSIGPKTAARLNRIGIRTVDDLLFADPAEIAERLGSRRIDEDQVRQWQLQATLVCRVPKLRGHDAELLVAIDLLDPEGLAESDPAQVFRQIDKLVKSPEGRRILRGGKRPDMEEVVRWVEWAQGRRSLRAA